MIPKSATIVCFQDSLLREVLSHLINVVTKFTILSQDEVEEDGEEGHALVEDEVGSSNPSITVTTEFAPLVEAVPPAIKGSTESLG